MNNSIFLVAKIKSKLRRLDDDGWVFVTVVSLIISFYFLTLVSNVLYAVLGFFIGSIYEQLIEYSAHRYLQHGKTKVYEYFEWRHGRHHKEPKFHHALQPVSITTIVVILLLFPAIITLDSDISKGVVSGFLFTHFLLNIYHYDLHAKNKILPVFFRDSSYYKFIRKTHFDHHLGRKTNFYYSITFPYIDKLIVESKLDNVIRAVYLFTVRLLEREK